MNKEILLLRAKEVCEILNISAYQTLLRWVKNGKFPRPIKITKNRYLLWARADIDEWLRQNRFYKD